MAPGNKKFWQETWFRDPSFRFNESCQICTTQKDDISTDRSSVGFTMVYQDEQKLPNSYLASLRSFTATNHSTSLCHLFVAPTSEENHPKLRRTESISHSSSLSQTFQGAVIAVDSVGWNQPPPPGRAWKRGWLSHRCVWTKSTKRKIYRPTQQTKNMDLQVNEYIIYLYISINIYCTYRILDIHIYISIYMYWVPSSTYHTDQKGILGLIQKPSTTILRRSPGWRDVGCHFSWVTCDVLVGGEKKPFEKS